MANDPMAHLRARLDALGKVMTRLSRDGKTMRPERHTASESSRKSKVAPPDRPRFKRPQRLPTAT